MMRLRILGALAVAIMLGLGQPTQAAEAAKDSVTIVTKDGRRLPVTVELAATPEQLSQGLMFRKSLAADSGMLFDFGQARPVAMWMKNTLIPLDMLFMDKTGRVIHVEEYAVPGSLDPRGPTEPVLGVLEVAGGTARRLRLSPGDTALHPMFRNLP